MPAVLDGTIGCVDPVVLARRCQRQRPAVPTGWWFGQANRYCGPTVSCKPGYATILLARADLDAIDMAAAHTLTFTDGAARSVTISGLRFTTRVEAIDPGSPGSAGTTYLCELADRRADCQALSNAFYNWRCNPSDDDYAEWSKNPDTSEAWTWEELYEHLWNRAFPEITYPGIPEGINYGDNVPEQIDGQAVRAADLLDDVLNDQGLAVAYHPATDTFTIQNTVGADTDDFDAWVTDQGDPIWDVEPVQPKRPLSEFIRVLFPVFSDDFSLPFDSVYAVDVRDRDFGARSGDDLDVLSAHYTVVQDTQPARVDIDGTVLNEAGLKERAAIAESIYFLRIVDRPAVMKAWEGFRADSELESGPKFIPEDLDWICWEDTGAPGKGGTGPRTVVGRASPAGHSPVIEAEWESGLDTGGPFLEGKLWSDQEQVHALTFARTGGTQGPVKLSGGPVPGRARDEAAKFSGGGGADGVFPMGAGAGESPRLGRIGPYRDQEGSVAGFMRAGGGGGAGDGGDPGGDRSRRWWHRRPVPGVVVTQGHPAEIQFPGIREIRFKDETVTNPEDKVACVGCTTTLAPCTGTCLWNWNATTDQWDLDTNNCVVDGCVCTVPQFCGDDSQTTCVVTDCGRTAGRQPFCPDQGGTTTGTSTTEPPDCGTCTWVYDHATFQWFFKSDNCFESDPFNHSSPGTCVCPDPPGPSADTGGPYTRPCVIQPHDSFECPGACRWRWDNTNSFWVLEEDTCNPCPCDPPDYSGTDDCNIDITGCERGTSSTTTTEPPCTSCQCTWQADGSAWNLIEPCRYYGTVAGDFCPDCNCFTPSESASTAGQIIRNNCTAEFTTTTSTTTPTPCGQCVWVYNDPPGEWVVHNDDECDFHGNSDCGCFEEPPVASYDGAMSIRDCATTTEAPGTTL